VGQHSSASASRLLGLDGFEVLAAQVVGGEWQLEVQTTATVVGCVGCGVRAEAHGRRTVRVRDLPIGGRPVVLFGASASGAVGSPPAGSAPGLSRRPRSTPGQC
jgi:zinc-finger of transposase IS204/IS1001/IS1096/IS1165